MRNARTSEASEDLDGYERIKLLVGGGVDLLQQLNMEDESVED